MAIELRLCEPLHVPMLLRALRSWRRGPSVAPEDDCAAAPLLGLTLTPELGFVWLVEHRGAPVGYAVTETCASSGFLWQEARLTALYLIPDARELGVGRVVRRVLGELLLGRGIGLVTNDATRDDRHWARLTVPAAVTTTAACVAA